MKAGTWAWNGLGWAQPSKWKACHWQACEVLGCQARLQPFESRQSNIDYLELLIAQRGQGVRPGGAARGQQHGQHRYCQQ
jgi:hypothetical protein